jgi:hypothetical protein
MPSKPPSIDEEEEIPFDLPCGDELNSLSPACGVAVVRCAILSASDSLLPFFGMPSSIYLYIYTRSPVPRVKAIPGTTF